MDRSELKSCTVRHSAKKMLFIGANFVYVFLEFGEWRHVMSISDEGSLDVQMLLKQVKNEFGIQSQGCRYFMQKFDQDWNECYQTFLKTSIPNLFWYVIAMLKE